MMVWRCSPTGGAGGVNGRRARLTRPGQHLLDAQSVPVDTLGCDTA
jgi:hypothetical protein